MPAVSALPARTRPSGAGSTESSRPSAGLAILRPGFGAKLDSMTVNPDEGRGSRKGRG